MKYKYNHSNIDWINKYPEHWKIDRLKDICVSIKGGGTPKSSIPEYWDGGNIIWITPTDFSNKKGEKYINDSEKKITVLGLAKSSAKEIEINSVIMSSRASIGEPKINKKVLTTNQGFISFTPGHKITSDFLYYLIKGYIGEYFSIVAMGTTFMEISRTKAKQVKVPIPPIQEQKAIAKYLDNIYDKINETIKIKFGNVVVQDSEKKDDISQYSLLQSYLKSITYECVTGKKQIWEGEIENVN